MTTNKLVYEKDFFHFDKDNIVASPQKRVINPRSQTDTRIEITDGKTPSEKRLVSKYDLEIFPMADPADVFCNIKTIMTWDFEIQTPQEFGSLQFSETLLHNVLNQIHFASTILRQHFFLDFATMAGLLHKPNPKNIHKQLKESFPSLADLNLKDDYPFLFSYWY